ncbi:hypothetical protein B4U80_03353 [Leptotrombidium deliense]|uniref:Uncharacterized protein n=1 Tax=Leptotrombidium deliense TaxID=299467 RepID=A0A443RZM0_9ACAR|nr:hypothetical protein B4U80_03353 [Leptotrombidium deliense]
MVRDFSQKNNRSDILHGHDYRTTIQPDFVRILKKVADNGQIEDIFSAGWSTRTYCDLD